MIIPNFRILPILAFTDADHWRPGIGDPTFMGWFTVVAYFVAMALAACAAVSSPQQQAGRRELGARTFWWLMTGLLLFLGINKQLDLQTWLTLTGRTMAKSEGWYAQRRVFQSYFIAAIGVGGLTITTVLLYSVRNRLKDFGLAMVGIIFLGCFVLVRAASFHHVDRLLLSEIGGLRMNWILEIGGIFWVGLAAWLAWRRNQNARSNISRNFIWVTAGDRL